MSLIAVTLAVLAAVALLIASRNATTLCVLEVVAGTVSVKRGGLAPGILSDIGDVMRRPVVERATVRVSRRDGSAHLDVRGTLSDAQRQQLRNVVGRVPLAQLRSTRRKRR